MCVCIDCLWVVVHREHRRIASTRVSAYGCLLRRVSLLDGERPPSALLEAKLLTGQHIRDGRRHDHPEKARVVHPSPSAHIASCNDRRARTGNVTPLDDCIPSDHGEQHGEYNAIRRGASRELLSAEVPPL